jgi:hypothetical protein
MAYRLAAGTSTRSSIKVNVEGKDVIVVVAYCRTPADFDPKREILVVKDGGACYFEALYDPRNRTFFNFKFHGVG